jgi:hypothetical protein
MEAQVNEFVEVVQSPGTPVSPSLDPMARSWVALNHESIDAFGNTAFFEAGVENHMRIGSNGVGEFGRGVICQGLEGLQESGRYRSR